MNITEVLHIVDELVKKKTGDHLDDLQKSIITGLCNKKTYDQIASEFGYESANYIGDESRKLFKILSEELGEEINKSNFCWTIERVINSQLTNFGNTNINYCPNCELANHPLINNQETKVKFSHHDLTLAPQIIKFYNRETELKILYNYIFKQNIRLISVLGLSGIGKTYLVKRFVDLNLDNFEVIIWKSLKYPESLDLLIDDILNICKIQIKPNINNKLDQLFTLFKEKRCLIILDDVQNIFIKGDFAGKYKPEYQNYQDFLTRITETEYQSNLILISQEQCDQMCCLDEELYPIKCLNLSGFDDKEILNNIGLKDEDSWLNLVNLYEGNPFYLKCIANSIKNIYDGNVAEFLAENQNNCGTGILPVNQINLPVIPTQIQTNLQLLFNRLSPIEQQIVIKLSNSDQLLSREDLKEKLDLSSTDLINSLESLQQRYLVTKIKEDKIMFKLSPVFREYVKNLMIN